MRAQIVTTDHITFKNTEVSLVKCLPTIRIINPHRRSLPLHRNLGTNRTVAQSFTPTFLATELKNKRPRTAHETAEAMATSDHKTQKNARKLMQNM